MASSPTDEPLHRLVRLCGEMRRLANQGEEAREDRGCSIVFARVRDAAHDLRRLAEQELAAHRVKTAPGEPDRSVADGPAPDRPAADSPVPAAGAMPKRVLIVEDDPDIVTFLARWFEDQGCRTVEAADGLQAIELAAGLRPDLITLDMSMPVKTGVSAYRDLKEDPLTRSIPVIVITGVGRAFGEIERRRSAVPRPEGFIAKPIDLAELTRTVQRILAEPRGVEDDSTRNIQPTQNRRNR